MEGPSFSPLYATSSNQLFTRAASGFVITAGTPVATLLASRYSSVAFDASTNEGISLPVELPDNWNTIAVDFYWSQEASGSGDVVWSCTNDRAGDGESLAVSSGGGFNQVTVTAPASQVLKISTIRNNVAVDNTKLLNLRVGRTAADAGDTLPNDAMLIGVLLRRLT